MHPIRIANTTNTIRIFLLNFLYRIYKKVRANVNPNAHHPVANIRIARGKTMKNGVKYRSRGEVAVNTASKQFDPPKNPTT
jgi:hypothetical protein